LNDAKKQFSVNMGLKIVFVDHSFSEDRRWIHHRTVLRFFEIILSSVFQIFNEINPPHFGRGSEWCM